MSFKCFHCTYSCDTRSSCWWSSSTSFIRARSAVHFQPCSLSHFIHDHFPIPDIDVSRQILQFNTHHESFHFLWATPISSKNYILAENLVGSLLGDFDQEIKICQAHKNYILTIMYGELQTHKLTAETTAANSEPGKECRGRS